MKQTTDSGKAEEEFQPVHRLMQRGIADDVFPGGVLLVATGKEIRFHQSYGVTDRNTCQPVTIDTFFDLASLTKSLATTPAVMKLVEQGKLHLETTLGTILPEFASTDKSGIRIRNLLDHTSGLPDWRPYYEVLSGSPQEKGKRRLLDLLAREPLVHPIGEKTIYSDLGFMVLSRIIEETVGEPVDRFVCRTVYQPLGIRRLFYPGMVPWPPGWECAATEECPWREKMLCGEVHDDNAWSTGGVDGHAGLFGTARDVHLLLCELLFAYRGESATSLFGQSTAKCFLSRSPGSERALGFDIPEKAGSSSGTYFSKKSVGHLGFTGTSFWMDLERGAIVILLTNRVHFGRENIRIRDFRPVLHDAVMVGLSR